MKRIHPQGRRRRSSQSPVVTQGEDATSLLPLLFGILKLLPSWDAVSVCPPLPFRELLDMPKLCKTILILCFRLWLLMLRADLFADLCFSPIHPSFVFIRLRSTLSLVTCPSQPPRNPMDLLHLSLVLGFVFGPALLLGSCWVNLINWMVRPPCALISSTPWLASPSCWHRFSGL